MSPLKIALPKGKNAPAISLLNKKGFFIPSDINDSRKYIIQSEDKKYEFILVKPIDIPIIVEHGAADIGIVGKDILLENPHDVLELLDLETSPGRLSVLAPIDATLIKLQSIKVATTYRKVATTYFMTQGQQVEIIKLNGLLELATQLGLCNFIVELLEGATEVTPSHQEIATIVHISDRLIVNRSKYYSKQKEIDDLCSNILAEST